MKTVLKPNGSPVIISGVTLRTPGMTGNVTVQKPVDKKITRDGKSFTSDLLKSLDDMDFEEQYTIEITDIREVNVGSPVTRNTIHGEPAFEIEVQPPADSYGQLILSMDESGISWSLARDKNNNIDINCSGGSRTFVIPQRVSKPDGKDKSRGLVGFIGKKIIKVLIFPIAGLVGQYFAAKWEEKKRPYQIRIITPTNYTSPEAELLTNPDWFRSEKSSLLIVHGTFSRANEITARFPADYIQKLCNQYDGRVFAFDHYTLTNNPKENVQWFIDQIPDDTKLQLDIICHSRGGLVSRTLAEKQSQFAMGSKKINVRKIIFVATPNAGTPLTDGKYMEDFIDSYTNMLHFFPDNGLINALEGIINVVKELAVGAMDGLKGLQAMNPSGKFLTEWMNRGPACKTAYYALGANFEPTQSGLMLFKDHLMDNIFKNTENDLVVPTNSVFEKNGCDAFPINNKHIFDAKFGIYHGGFFTHPAVREKIWEWLQP